MCTTLKVNRVHDVYMCIKGKSVKFAHVTKKKKNQKNWIKNRRRRFVDLIIDY